MENEYLEFTVGDMQLFDELVAFFTQLKFDKDHAEIQDPADYLPFIDNAAWDFFWWPTNAEYDEWLKAWYATPAPERWTAEHLKHPWMFEAMIDALKNGEYILQQCHLIVPNTARLEFYALAYPYGGVGCMQALIEAFGCTVTEISDGGSPPRRIPSSD
jgi:hypothetical protein